MRIEEICYGAYRAKVNVSRGGNCISLRNVTYDCRILREPDYENGIFEPYLYGMPILFPVNRISDGRFVFEGRNYDFPVNEESTNCFLHGTLHEIEMEVVEQERHRIMLYYKATQKKPYLTFPHSFEIRMEYRLSDQGLLQEVEICNLSSENMPVLLGFHTTFCIPFINGAAKEDLSVRADIAEEYERSEITHLPTGKMLVYDEISKGLEEGNFVPNRPISRHYRKSGAGVMSITDRKHGITMIYENCPELSYRLILGNGNDFLCMEPQTCMVNCANSSLPWEMTGFDYIMPGKKKKYWSNISVNLISL